MALETASYVSQLNSSNPTSTDTVSQADDHLRLIKSVLKNTFPNLDQPVTATPAQINSPVPKGFIGLWSGSIATIPSGWVLCDGNNSTPDLRQKFVMGAGNVTNTPGTTGGSSTATLTTANLPAHTHDFSGVTGSGGSHTHSVTDPGHIHSYNVVSVVPGTISYGGGGPGIGATGSTTGASTTGISIVADGAHTHAFSGTTTSVGSGTAFSILPPYYALAYIMKT